MSYTGKNMDTYIDQYRYLLSQLERMGKDSAIPESHREAMLLASIGLNCALESIEAAHRTKEVSGLTWDYVASTIIDEYNPKPTPGSIPKFKNRHKKSCKSTSRSQPTKDANAEDHLSSNSDTDATIRALTAALKSAWTDAGARGKKYTCELSGKSGHTEDRCF